MLHHWNIFLVNKKCKKKKNGFPKNKIIDIKKVFKLDKVIRLEKSNEKHRCINLIWEGAKKRKESPIQSHSIKLLNTDFRAKLKWYSCSTDSKVLWENEWDGSNSGF